MILQALNGYYQRLAEDPAAPVAAPGFADAKISFCLLLDPAGELKDVQDLRLREGKKLLPRPLRAPQGVKRTVGIAANFLWDHTGYVLGADGKGKPERLRETFAAFKTLAHQLGDGLEDPGVRAVLAFLDAWQPERAAGLPSWEAMCGQNLVFRLDGERGYVHESPAARRAWLAHWGGEGEEDALAGQCLVTGRILPLARLHPAIKGVWGAQTSGANLVSFNLEAFKSYGKEQGRNAPVSTEAAFAYTTALNRLLLPTSRQKLTLGDASVVFWSERPTALEGFFGPLLGAGGAEDTAQNEELGAFLKGLKQGIPASPELTTPFYVLGLSPNASRLSVRFWLASTVGEMERRLGEHLGDLELIRLSDKQPAHPPLWMLLRETAAQGESKNVPPLLAGEVARAILTGLPYPRALLTALIERARADHAMGYLRAAFLKAYLGRLRRLNENYRRSPQSMEVTVSLDENSTNPAYRLGRLFAVLEDLQRSALNTVNATIRDKYFASASSAPRATFPRLLSLSSNHYLTARKGEFAGWAYTLEQVKTDIINGLDASGFPATLTLEEQGLFFLGYYHQKAHRPAKGDPEVLLAAAEAEAAADPETTDPTPGHEED